MASRCVISKCILESSVVFFIGLSLTLAGTNTNVQEAREFLDYYNEEAPKLVYKVNAARWAFNTNITDHNRQQKSETSLKSAEFQKQAYLNASNFDDTNFPEDVKRQFMYIKDLGAGATVDEEKLAEFNDLISSMSGIYSKGEVCKPDKPDECYTLEGEPSLTDIMAKSTDYEELTWAWKGFRDEVGVANKPHYIRYVQLANEIAQAKGYSDNGAYWRSRYETDDIAKDAYKIYEEILPLYKQMHAYVRRKLAKYYRNEMSMQGRIPANVLGDMWGRFWGRIYDHVKPYPDVPNIDVTEEMIKQGYTVEKMFNMTDEFFTSCGMIPAPQEFWDNTMMVKPTDGRDVVCHPSAMDLGNGKDFRIKMCTEINMWYFLVIHHEFGHIQYYLQYKDLPISFRDDPNPAFHEAVGEVISLSVGTPKHLYEVGLLEENLTDEETDINFLLKTALDTIGTLPFSLALEQWRYDVFAGNISQDEWTQHWWKLKNDIVGVKPPVERTETDFEPGAMFHITIDYSFLRYYMRTIIQFQFHKALCKVSGHVGPLHRCDIYRSKQAGQKLTDMLRMGSSKHWTEAMEVMTGQREISADAIKDYYAPLMAWLEKTNAENDEYIGWDRDAGHMNSASVLLLAVSFVLRFIFG